MVDSEIRHRAESESSQKQSESQVSARAVDHEPVLKFRHWNLKLSFSFTRVVCLPGGWPTQEVSSMSDLCSLGRTHMVKKIHPPCDTLHRTIDP
jgi:hypothetical protein